MHKVILAQMKELTESLKQFFHFNPKPIRVSVNMKH